MQLQQDANSPPPPTAPIACHYPPAPQPRNLSPTRPLPTQLNTTAPAMGKDTEQSQQRFIANYLYGPFARLATCVGPSSQSTRVASILPAFFVYPAVSRRDRLRTPANHSPPCSGNRPGAKTQRRQEVQYSTDKCSSRNNGRSNRATR